MKSWLNKDGNDICARGDRSFYFLLLLISVASLLLMIKSGSETGLWNDEFATIVSLHRHDIYFREWVSAMQFSDYQTGLNFYLIAARIWYSIVPLSDNWLLLMSEIMVAISVFFVGLAGRVIRNGKCGILAAVLYAFSYQLFEIGHEFRFYPWLVLFTAAAFYYYCKTTIEETPKWRYIILFGLAMGLAVNGQILAGFLPIVFFFADCILINRKKKKARALISYLIALPFALFPLMALISTYRDSYGEGVSHLAKIGDSSIAGLFGLTNELWLGNQIWIAVITYIAFALGLYVTFSLAKGNGYSVTGTFRQQYLFSFCSIAPVICILMNFILVRASGEVANIFAERYFQYLYPLMFIAVSFVIILAFEHIHINKTQFAIIAIGIALFLAVHTYNLSYNDPKFPGIKGEAEWVIQHSEIIGDDALVVLPYYVSNRGEVIRQIYFKGKYFYGIIKPHPFNSVTEEIIVSLSKPTIVTFDSSMRASSEEVLERYYSIIYRDESMGATVWKLKEGNIIDNDSL